MVDEIDKDCGVVLQERVHYRHIGFFGAKLADIGQPLQTFSDKCKGSLTFRFRLSSGQTEMQWVQQRRNKEAEEEESADTGVLHSRCRVRISLHYNGLDIAKDVS